MSGLHGKRCGLAALVLFILTIPVGNWVVLNVGTTCYPDGPCVIPVWPGLMSPSAVLLAGLALVLRDAVQSLLGNRATIAAILCGTLLSGLLSDPAVVIGSAAAFLFSELADFLVYTPLRRRYPSSAILVSGLVGSIVDSCIFLQLAFGSLEFVTGQVVGKFWMSLAAAALHYLWRRRRAAHAEGGAFA